MYIAHINDNGEMQSVKEHLENTEKLCREWAVEPVKELAGIAARLHDIGKYSDKFQERINGNGHIHVEHAVCGAKEAEVLFTKKSPCTNLLQYVIAGHHTGLPDGGAGSDGADVPTLQGRLKHKTEDYSAYKSEITAECPSTEAFDYFINGCREKAEIVERYAFLTKYVFSCLKDADCIDTEKFCNPDTDRGMTGDFQKALERVNQKLAGFTADTPVKIARAELQKQAELNLDSKADISFMQMPTGSGKTLCSLKTALEIAVAEGRKRIIYIIPYTSIIEQTARTFSDILGDSVEILEHHSNYDFDKNENDTSTAEKLRKNCENWDAKLIVTTNAQFFQSLYHYKGSRLRKLHNLADSVLVFDEIHMLPIDHLQPCLRGIGYVAKFLGSHALLLSATMPDFMPLIERYAPMARVHELITDKSSFGSFANCGYKYIGETDYEHIACEASQQENALCVVNTRKAARELFGLISGKKFHLSTFMTPVSRLKILNEIRDCLAANEHITVVSTSLIEAGVDLDFAAVYRQLSGLDSILQAGGRCNREGLRKGSQVFVFETEDKPQRELGLRAEVTRSMIKEYEDITAPECISEYYRRIFAHNESVIERNSIAKFNDGKFDAENFINDIPFRSYAEYFEYISSESIAVVVPHDEEAEELLRDAEFSSTAKRKLQRYSVTVYPYMLKDMLERGIVIGQAGMYVLSSMMYYDEETGIKDEISDSEFIM